MGVVTPVAEEKREPQWGNLALLRLSAFGFGSNGIGLTMDVMILPALTLLLVSDDLKNTYLGFLGFSGLLVAAVVQLGIAPLSDRTRSPLGRRVPYLLGGCALLCLGLVWVGLAPNFTVLLVAWLFIQGSINVGYGPYQALIQDLVPAHRVGMASSYKILSDAIGALLLISLAGELLGFAGGSKPGVWIWLALGVLGASMLVTTGITSSAVIARRKAEPEPPPAPPERRAGLHPQLKRFLVSRVLIITSISAFQTYGMFFLKDVAGSDNPAQAAGRMILVIGSALALSVYLTGWVSDRTGRKPIILAGATGAAVSTIWMLSADSTGQVLAIASAVGFSVGALLSANWALANDLGTSGREAMHMGLVNLATIGGAAVAKVLGPGIDLLNRLQPTVEILGFSHAFSGYSALLVGCGVLFMAGALVLMPLKANIRDRVPSSELP